MKNKKRTGGGGGGGTTLSPPTTSSTQPHNFWCGGNNFILWTILLVVSFTISVIYVSNRQMIRLLERNNDRGNWMIMIGGRRYYRGDVAHLYSSSSVNNPTTTDDDGMQYMYYYNSLDDAVGDTLDDDDSILVDHSSRGEDLEAEYLLDDDEELLLEGGEEDIDNDAVKTNRRKEDEDNGGDAVPPPQHQRSTKDLVVYAAASLGDKNLITEKGNQRMARSPSVSSPAVSKSNQHEQEEHNHIVINMYSDDHGRERIRLRKTSHRPELSGLIHDTNTGIHGDVRFLLDFSILGFAKCATSFVMKWLSDHREIQIFDNEVCDLYDNKPALLVKKLYEDLPHGNYKRGFKCPGHFSRRPLRYFRRYFSKSVLVVGVRHPVRWFESYYNFRIRHGGGSSNPNVTNVQLPSPDKLIGQCIPEGHGVCTDRGNFHSMLAIFGKTNLTNRSERNLLRLREKYQYITPIDNPVFLYDVSQLRYDHSDHDSIQRYEQFKLDLQGFMGLSSPLPTPRNASTSKKPKYTKIDICDPRFDNVRTELINNGKRASLWIRKYFLNSSTVYVSSRSYFEQVLKRWKDDPCHDDDATATTPS